VGGRQSGKKSAYFLATGVQGKSNTIEGKRKTLTKREVIPAWVVVEGGERNKA